MDNQAVTMQVARLEKGKRVGEVVTLKECMQDSDPDVWGELNHVWGVRDGRWGVNGRADLRWHRGHPERRMPGAKGRMRWSDHDRWMYHVDQVADWQYGRMEVREDWWRFPHAPEWEIWWRGRALKGKVRDRLKVVVMKERFLQWQGAKVKAAVVRKEEVRRAAAVGKKTGDKKRLWKAGEKGRWWGEQMALVANQREVGFNRQFGDQLLGKGNRDIEETVLRVRVIAGFLATRVSPQMGVVEEADAGCRLCEGGRETNHHVMWECTGSPLVVMQRRAMVRELKEVWGELGLEAEEVALLAAVHSLGEGGGVAYCDWEEMSVALGEMGGSVTRREEQLSAMLHGWMGGEGFKHARRGDLGSSGMWEDLVEQMGVSRRVAEVAVGRVSSLVVGAQCKLWEVFCEQGRELSHGGIGRLVGGKMIQEAVIEEVLDRVSRAQGGVLLDGQARVRRMRTTKREVWLEAVGRARDRGVRWTKAVGAAYKEVEMINKAGKLRGGGAMTVREYVERRRGEREALQAAREEDGGREEPGSAEGGGGLLGVGVISAMGGGGDGESGVGDISAIGGGGGSATGVGDISATGGGGGGGAGVGDISAIGEGGCDGAEQGGGGGEWEEEWQIGVVREWGWIAYSLT